MQDHSLVSPSVSPSFVTQVIMGRTGREGGGAWCSTHTVVRLVLAFCLSPCDRVKQMLMHWHTLCKVEEERQESRPGLGHLTLSFRQVKVR
jgi:hypothetical protein